MFWRKGYGDKQNRWQEVAVAIHSPPSSRTLARICPLGQWSLKLFCREQFEKEQSREDCPIWSSISNVQLLNTWDVASPKWDFFFFLTTLKNMLNYFGGWGWSQSWPKCQSSLSTPALKYMEAALNSVRLIKWILHSTVA